ncbi:MAG TPA: hypothetical protein VFP65_27860, partial [Anaeromyxobacteraceae bacterium]|nr:hypothetical protein [Anaeromyxobacteraceae bacterium]
MSHSGEPGGGLPSADHLSAMFASAGAPLAVLRGPELVIEAANPALAALLPGAPLANDGRGRGRGKHGPRRPHGRRDARRVARSD